jgi:broad specificity phosphatase PhoE
MSHEEKYIKYKTKYLNLKNTQIGGNKQKSKVIKLIFVRHGESTQNIAENESYDSSNIVLTDKGIKEAIKTGKYLKKIFGKFDKVYSSPITRCVQTSNLITEEINYPSSSIITDDLLVEMGNKSNIEGLSQKEEGDLLDKNKKFTKIQKKAIDTENPFDKAILIKDLHNELNKYFEHDPTIDGVKENCKNFLNKLRESNEKQILIISHASVIDTFQRIICNIGINIELNISLKKFASHKELNGNCCIMCVKYENDKYNLIMPANTYHLN